MTRLVRLLPLVAALAWPLAGCGRADEPLVQAAPVEGPSPFRYPVALWDRGLEGETVLLVHVSEGGAVDSVKVYRTSGRAAFDSAAAQGATELRFLPAHQGGRTLTMWVKLPVRFSRDTTAPDTAH